jgi:hypothetical protein
MQTHHWQQVDLLDKVESLELKLKEERSKFKVGLREIGVIFLLWLIVSPLLWGVVVNSLVPTPIRNTMVGMTNFANDAVFGMQCKFRSK